jgi:hypothetical protein
MEQNPFIQDTTQSDEVNPFLSTSKDKSTNPGNIKVSPYSQSLGAKGDTGSIATFDTYEQGRSALDKLLTEGRQYKDKSVSDWISTYAPASDNNNPDAYRKALQQKGVPINKTYNQMSQAEKEVTLNSLEEYEKGKTVNPFLRKSTPTKEVPPSTEESNPFLFSKPAKEAYRKVSGLETAAEHTLFGIPVSAGGYAGMTAGAALGEEAGLALAPVTAGISTIAGPIIGGALGMFAGGYGTDKLLRAAGPESLNKLLDEGSRQHPYAAFFGDVASNFPVMGVGLPKTITLESGKVISAEKQAAMLITGGAGIETGREYATGEKIDPVKIGISALTMPLFAGEPTAIGKAVTFEKMRGTQSSELLADLQSKINGTEYENVIKNRITEEQNLKTFDQFKEDNLRNNYSRFKASLDEGATIPSFDEWKSRPGAQDAAGRDAGLRKRYDELMRQKAISHLETNNPELLRPDVNTAKLPTDTSSMRDFFYNFVGAKTQDGIIGDHIMRLADRDGINAEMRENIRKHAETGSALNPTEQQHYDKYFKETLKSLKSNIKYLMDKGIIPKEKMDENFFPRQLSPLDKETLERLREQGLIDEAPGMWDSIRDKLVGRDFGVQEISRLQSAGRDRTIFKLEKDSGGHSVIQIGKGGRVVEWTNGRGRVIAPDVSILTQDGRVKVGDKIFGGTIREGAIEEIEHHSPYRYNKDSLAVLLQKLNESREMVRANRMISELKNTSYFKQNAKLMKPGVEMPEGFVMPKGLDKLPELQGYAFHPRTAWILEDFAKQRQPTLLTEMSGMLVKNMMLNPLPHIFNEAWHLYNARGLTGWVTPSGVARFAKGMPEALKSVINQDPFYRDILNKNGSLLAPSTRTSPLENSIHQRALNEFAEGGGLRELARYFGRSALDMYDGISKASSKAMWVVRDTMYLQYVKELMDHKGLSMEAAVKEAERHLPNYRLPETIGNKVIGDRAGRLLSETLQNPNISVFSRYHYGMVKSIIETMKDVKAITKGSEGVAEFKEGVDTMAAIAVAVAALYPLMDMMAQHLTGNPDAKQRRAGPYHLGHAIGEVADGTKDPQAVLSAIFTFNPALMGLAQLGLDRNLYTGQHIYDPMSSPDVIASDVGKYLLQQVPQAGQVMRASAERKDEGFKAMEARQADIESPSREKMMKQKQMIMRLKMQAKMHDLKERIKRHL